MKKQIKITGIIGVIGATLMFLGDMFLYYSTNIINNFEEEIVSILGQTSQTRLIIGGLIGPFAAILYTVGFYQIYLAIKPPSKTIAKIIFALLGVGIIYGGSFHSLFPHLGFMSSTGSLEALALAEQYSITIFYLMFFPSLIAYVLLTYLIITNRTFYPKWIILVSPFVLFWFSSLVQLLPQPYMIIIAGGWSNLIFILFFSISTITLLKNKYE